MKPNYRRAILLGAFVGMCSCGGPAGPGIAEVMPYHLRTTKVPDDGVPMVRSEALAYLHGAVSPQERRDRLGHYLNVRWSATPGGGPVELVHEYRLAKTASEVHRKVLRFDEAAKEESTTRLKVIGKEYRELGPVLCWKVSLMQGGRVLDSEQSYLWE